MHHLKIYYKMSLKVLQGVIIRYIIYDLDIVTKDNRKVNKLIFIYYIPNNAAMDEKFHYIQFKNKIKSSIGSVHKDF